VGAHDELGEVPVAWLCAQDGAERLLAGSTACRAVGAFEYRAVHDVLSLTLLFSGRLPTARAFSPGELRLLRALVADDVEWALWCQGRLALGVPELPRADRDLAVRALGRLAAGRPPGGLPPDTPAVCAFAATLPGAGVWVGMALARQVLDPRARR
jgi:hypothetical protein